jgi:hypothetical protein
LNGVIRNENILVGWAADSTFALNGKGAMANLCGVGGGSTEAAEEFAFRYKILVVESFIGGHLRMNWSHFGKCF